MIIVVFALLAWYTAVLQCRCLDSKEGFETYPDIGHAAFGSTSHIAISDYDAKLPDFGLARGGPIQEEMMLGWLLSCTCPFIAVLTGCRS